jgi:hypothetical protein
LVSAAFQFEVVTIESTRSWNCRVLEAGGFVATVVEEAVGWALGEGGLAHIRLPTSLRKLDD